MHRILWLFTIVIFFAACARVGNPTGGEKDTTPPKILKTIPENKATNFKGQEIKIYFDEFIQLKNINNELLITPPQKKQPEITPLGTASKEIRIKFKDSLLPNTTYVINFGESIEDFNEGNKLGNYQFVFSTGNQIDSLSLKGKVTPLYFKKNPEKIILGLYPAEKFTDSIVFREPPFYVAKTGKNGNFQFNYLKKGKYKIIALADEVTNYVYNPQKEAIGFIDSIIEIPKDSMVNVYLFKERKKFKADKFEQVSHNHIKATYEGNIDSLGFRFLSPVVDSLILIEPAQTNIWYKSNSDSVKVEMFNGKYRKTLKGKRKEEKDSLKVILKIQAAFHPLDSLIIQGNIPIIKIDKNKIELLKDSLPSPFEIKERALKKWEVVFDKETGKKYQIKIFPGAATDYLGNKNKDTIQRNFAIAKADKFGKLVLTIPEINSPYFVELLDSSNKIIRKSPTTIQNEIAFDYLKPGKYYIRIIFDKNQNNKWDTGDYLKHLYPEKIILISKPVEVRANWDLNQKIDISGFK